MVSERDEENGIRWTILVRKHNKFPCTPLYSVRQEDNVRWSINGVAYKGLIIKMVAHVDGAAEGKMTSFRHFFAPNEQVRRWTSCKACSGVACVFRFLPASVVEVLWVESCCAWYAGVVSWKLLLRIWKLKISKNRQHYKNQAFPVYRTQWFEQMVSNEFLAFFA